jgi:hypothetical protein
MSNVDIDDVDGTDVSDDTDAAVNPRDILDYVVEDLVSMLENVFICR